MRPWGSTVCSTCKEGKCVGHLNTVLVDTTSKDSLQGVLEPPSAILKQKFMELKGSPVTDEFLVSAARRVLLTVEDTKIWIDHLTTVLEN